jgi:hypothetical protein
MTKYREGLPPRPAKMMSLPIDPRGYPIPWFVGEVDGVRDFRLADSRKRKLAQDNRLCWLCGGKLGRYMAFTIGPMCVVNRNTSEPGSHIECARYAAMACPHLTRPEAKARTANLPTENVSRLPQALDGNPGACAIYVTTTSEPYIVPGTRDWLIHLGEPERVEWYCRARAATREEVLSALNARLPLLEAIAAEHGEQKYLAANLQIAMRYLPDEKKPAPETRAGDYS